MGGLYVRRMGEDIMDLYEDNGEDSLVRAHRSIQLLTENEVTIDKLIQEGYQIEGMKKSRARKDFGKYSVIYMKPLNKDYFQLRAIARNG